MVARASEIFFKSQWTPELEIQEWIARKDLLFTPKPDPRKMTTLQATAFLKNIENKLEGLQVTVEKNLVNVKPMSDLSNWNTTGYETFLKNPAQELPENIKEEGARTTDEGVRTKGVYLKILGATFDQLVTAGLNHADDSGVDGEKYFNSYGRSELDALSTSLLNRDVRTLEELLKHEQEVLLVQYALGIHLDTPDPATLTPGTTEKIIRGLKESFKRNNPPMNPNLRTNCIRVIDEATTNRPCPRRLPQLLRRYREAGSRIFKCRGGDPRTCPSHTSQVCRPCRSSAARPVPRLGTVRRTND